MGSLETSSSGGLSSSPSLELLNILKEVLITLCRVESAYADTARPRS